MSKELPLRDPGALTQLQADVGEDAIPMLMTAFVKELSTSSSSIHTSFADNNLDLLETTAHALKSAAASFGAMALSDVCRSIEMAARGRDDKPVIAALLDTFDAVMEQTLGVYRS